MVRYRMQIVFYDHLMSSAWMNWATTGGAAGEDGESG